jgi:predicted ABC-type transport system involved in lysophospholipase L1 biosynthesis ATPase subunit
MVETETLESSRHGELVLAATNVHKRFGEGEAAVWALRGCDLSLHRGEVVALMGPSGSGKSTLLLVVSGLDSSTEGEVVLDGRRLDELSERERARWRAEKIGFVLQRDNLIPALTLEENVAAPLLMAGWRRPRALERARQVLERVGLAGRARAWPPGVSGGEAQRAAVARACAGRPVLIVADEPTGALDSNSGAAVLDLFIELARESGAAALLATHDGRVAAAADHVLQMVDGRIR